jgi:L-ascorbate metabolism protein UlaG (beta-lactamase superfamily)
VDLQAANSALRVTGTPARHGPVDGDRGPVIGFVLALVDSPDRGVYISGDTVWFEGVAEVARRFEIHTVVLFMGAARVPAVGPHHLTMTAAEGIEVACAFPRATLVPLHFEGWAHFSESREVVTRAFDQAGLDSRSLVVRHRCLRACCRCG